MFALDSTDLEMNSSECVVNAEKEARQEKQQEDRSEHQDELSMRLFS